VTPRVSADAAAAVSKISAVERQKRIFKATSFPFPLYCTAAPYR
jgi:hypothetical protein